MVQDPEKVSGQPEKLDIKVEIDWAIKSLSAKVYIIFLNSIFVLVSQKKKMLNDFIFFSFIQ